MRLTDDYSEDEQDERNSDTDENGGLEPRSLNVTIAVTAGVVLADIAAAALLAALIAWVAALTAVTLACAIPGIVCIAGGNIVDVGGLYAFNIPEMPYICSLLLGLSLIALAVVFGVGAEFSRLHVTQAILKLVRWNKNSLRLGGKVSPPLPLMPWITSRKRKIMRAMVLVSLVVFVIALVLCLIAMIIAARSLMPWSVWGWFE